MTLDTWSKDQSLCLSILFLSINVCIFATHIYKRYGVSPSKNRDIAQAMCKLISKKKSDYDEENKLHPREERSIEISEVFTLYQWS